MTNLTPQQEQTAERLAYLLANSSMDEKVKKMIASHLDSLSESRIAFLMESLEKELSLAGTLDSVLVQFAQAQEDAQKKLAAKQKTMASKMVNSKLKDVQLEEARASIPETTE